MEQIQNVIKLNKTTHTKSIFIAIAPNHISTFESIIKNNLHKGKTTLLNPGNFKYDNSLWNEVINGNMNLQYNVSSRLKKLVFQLNKLMGYKRFIYKTIKKINFDENINYYYCNLDDILSNHIYCLINKTKNRVNFAVEDGILNYYYPKESKKQIQQKKLLSKLIGLKFTPFTNHPTNINSKSVKGQFVRLPSDTINPAKSLQLPFDSISYNPEPNSVLIIGQDIMHNYHKGEEYYTKRLGKLFQIIQNDHSDKLIIYKPHRNGNTNTAEKLLCKYFEDYKLFQSITTVEECIKGIRPKYIYSFESSAIINLKIAMKDQVMFAILPFEKKVSTILSLYTKLRIRILK